MAEKAIEMTEYTDKKLRESKRDKFVKLAESRTKSAIKAIRIISKLGNKNAYDYNEADVRKIVKALNSEVEAMKNRMSTTKTSEEVDFKL